MSIVERLERLSGSGHVAPGDVKPIIEHCASKKLGMTDVEARALIKTIIYWFKESCLAAGYPEKKIRALTTKFRDAGRRSAPWKPTSSRVPGRPQDGSDGNRINRWLMPEDHKFYANEVNATLVEIKYALQTMSMEGAPDSPIFDIGSLFTPWLVEHDVKPGQYFDPVQLIPIRFLDFLEEPRTVQSGHLFPLDRGGRHLPENTFLMLYRSNQIQGNLTINELLKLMNEIVKRHSENEKSGSRLEKLIQK